MFYAQEAQHKLERGRYVNFGDWLHRWETLEPQHLVLQSQIGNGYNWDSLVVMRCGGDGA